MVLDRMHKNLIKILVVIVAISGFLLVLYRYKNYPERPGPIQEFTYQYSKVLKVTDSSIVIEGMISSLDPKDKRRENRTVTFKVTPQTIFKNTKLSFTQEQILSGSPFHPKTEFLDGSIKDFLTYVSVGSVKTLEDLFTADRATLVEINYFTNDSPPLPVK